MPRYRLIFEFEADDDKDAKRLASYCAEELVSDKDGDPQQSLQRLDDASLIPPT